MIYGAAQGIREGWPPPALAPGDPVEAGGYPMLPRTLEDSVASGLNAIVLRRTNHA